MSIEIKQKTVAAIGDNEYDIIYHFKLAIPGWECDSDGYIIMYDDEPRLLLSDHGFFEIISKDQVHNYQKIAIGRKDIVELKNLVESYRDLITSTSKAMTILEGESEA